MSTLRNFLICFLFWFSVCYFWKYKLGYHKTNLAQRGLYPISTQELHFSVAFNRTQSHLPVQSYAPSCIPCLGEGAIYPLTQARTQQLFLPPSSLLSVCTSNTSILLPKWAHILSFYCITGTTFSLNPPLSSRWIQSVWLDFLFPSFGLIVQSDLTENRLIVTLQIHIIRFVSVSRINTNSFPGTETGKVSLCPACHYLTQ